MRKQLGTTPSGSTDAIIKSYLQRQNVPETVSVSSATTLTLTTANSTYVFSGSSATTWTLPALSGNTGVMLTLENRGSAAITLVPAGSDHIWFISSITTMTIAAGGSLTLINDGTYWNALSVDLTNNVVGNLSVTNLNGGSGASASTYWRGDGTWATPAGGGGGSPSETRTATAAGTTTLTSSSNQIQVFTGTSTQTVVLPTTSVTQAMQWLIINESTGAVTVNASGGTTAIILAANTSAVLSAAVNTPTTAANWDVQYGGINMVSGKALTVNNTMNLSSVDGAAFNFGNTPSVLTGQVSVTTTQVVVLSYTIPANTLVSGMTFQFEAFGVQASNSATVTYYICIGTHNSTADTVLTSIALSANTYGTNFEGMVTIRSIGASGTAIASAQMLAGQSSTSVNSAVSAAASATTINTTGTLYLTIQCVASSPTQNVQQAFIGALQV